MTNTNGLISPQAGNAMYQGYITNEIINNMSHE